MPTLPNNQKSETWGYTLLNSTIDSLIRNFEGQSTVELYPEFRERRERAHELIFECVGKKSCLFYIRRQGSGKDPGEEIWDLTIATDESEFELPKRLKELRKTLGFRAAVQKNGTGGLKILSAYLLQPSRGQGDGYALPLRLQLVPNHHHPSAIPPKVLAQIATMPVCGHHVPTEEQLQAWKAFLKVEERIAKARQFCVVFVNYKYSNNKKQIAFEINLNSATLDGSEENYLDVENFWERVKQAKNQDIKFSDTVPSERNRRSSRQLGTIEKIDQKYNIIHIRLERDLVEYIAAGNYQLPGTGYLFFDAAGDIKQIERKEKALEQLRQGRTQNPYLGNFLFDASQARSIKKTVKIKSQDLLLSAANPGQKASVEKVLAADDLVLIQGPPGTGKTTVIAEICYQVALRGGRTLITSQANLAVDNALSRLVHNPVIRAVRKGRAEKVGEEGQPFLEDQVIGRWLENTATDCENNLAQRQENIKIFTQLLASSTRFKAYLESEEEFNHKQNESKLEKENLKEICQIQEIAYQESLVNQNKIESLKIGLKNLLKNVPVNWDSAEVKDFLPCLQPYTKNIHQVESFRENVCQAIKYVDELGFVRPARGAFGLAAWLSETVATEIDELKKIFSYADDVIVTMSELTTLVQAFKKDSTYLHQLQTEYQQFLNKDKSLQPTIQLWENRKREIDYIIEAVIEWKSTAYNNLYQVVKNCQQSDLPLTDNMIDLPLGLLMFANNLKLPLVPKNYKISLPDWKLLTKAISYEIQGNFTDRRGKQHSFSYFLQENFSQIPLVLSKSDRTQWQVTYQELNDYQLLTSKQRKSLVENTQSFLTKLQRTYGAAYELDNIHSTLTQITQELLDIILANSRQCVAKVKTEAEQQLNILQKQQNQLNELPNNGITQEQIFATQSQVEKASQDANLQLARVVNMLEELNKKPNIPAKLRNLTEKYLAKQSNIWEQHQEFSKQIKICESNIVKLEPLISSLEPIAILEMIQDSLHEELIKLKKETKTAQKKLDKSQIKLNELEQQLQLQIPESLIIERNWWQITWQEIPAQFKVKNTESDLFNLEFLNLVKDKFDIWQQQLQNEENYLQRYQNFVQDWINKLRQPSERDSNDLRRIYLDNANVVGITCVQAANYNFSEEFQSFDVVIIDEVSKCTPPELLIPALKGKKLVMVGDHRQLPPMLDTSTVEEVAQKIGNTREELQFLEESLFKSQFETADNSIKQMLNTQYRMHPNIMGAINQFYDGKLECGILEPDSKRAHHLAGEIIKPEHHLIWVKMPREQEFQEERLGTSFFNIREIDVIENICHQFENVWSSKVANGEPKKEIAVITFYGSQLRKIDERLQSEIFPSLQIRTGTVDRFQGMERPVVIVSMVRNNHQGDVGFAKKPERVNVAFSRAQELLVIVGCHDLFTSKPGTVGGMYSEVANIVSRHGGFIDVSCF
ncbi:AAA family ATPase [Anabaena cylindrica FACHB-243]|uniref:Translation initiation factor IF-2 domain-containing protein n=1 Tax=Anabaena cylindrica (strain ATCC 27899 / PCC 7122) TaxID=272123 RepID=K9ZKY2_ANACC|nr:MULTISPECIES: AAA domain-containing protein [Anabaena]AFZ58995.1 translation initiation factor IF-2 domain-containing protein [Anabaena cylindrica PCC 7122]MBD2420661.1 AAA family ATPase [Anabaena cylindrica FACHB-243]MBY5281443.1 AAA family ATPase [Anabaena sp. CCAP 1446/1C]MBY5311096.1 AAA family ATPase [Anabaena sp. CCAP 1446/1C]MCM2410000.1 AAA domain-containing protein [Anabaena sp. CCAP 1446/1C]